jgi:hypothetical protein
MAYLHGMKKHAFYKRWNGMIQRCYNSKNPHYPDHGGKAIIVEHCWDRRNPDGVVNFIIWVEEELEKLPEELRLKPFKITRIDDTKNFCPSNCTLVSTAVCCQKRRTSVINFEMAKEIRSYVKKNPTRSFREVAAIFDLENAYTVNRCVTGKSWKNVDKFEAPIQDIVKFREEESLKYALRTIEEAVA